MKAAIIAGVALVAFAANADDAARLAALVLLGLADVVVVGWALGVRRG